MVLFNLTWLPKFKVKLNFTVCVGAYSGNVCIISNGIQESYSGFRFQPKVIEGKVKQLYEAKLKAFSLSQTKEHKTVHVCI